MSIPSVVFIESIVAKPLKFYFYPNPSNNFLLINSNANEASLGLYSLTGIRVKYIENISIPEYKMDISDLANGIYILEYQSESMAESRRIVKISDR